MVTGETGHRFPTVLIPVAEVHNFVYEAAIILALYLAVNGALEMTKICKHAITRLVQVTNLNLYVKICSIHHSVYDEL